MKLKAALKWVFFLFCLISTSQMLFSLIVIGGIMYPAYFDIPTYSFRELLEFLLIALASALPILVLAESKILSRIPMNVRRVIHFLLTFGVVCGLLIYWGWYEISAWLLLPFALFLVIYILAVIFYEKDILKKRTAQQEAEEQRQLQYYTEELERYQLGVRKFKHDYQNILLSLEAYIEDGDMADLQQYYYSSIKPASDIITKDSFTLDGLDKIKIRAIKSFLTAKFMLAQNIDIHITFEANDNINDIPLDLVALVRILGILLDNAIEELAELGHGELFISCLKWDAGITFIVQNTCRSDLPSPQQLWQAGFSTKGESRGLGLSNLSELVDACPNVTLSTKISENSFRQELLIEDRGKKTI